MNIKKEKRSNYKSLITMSIMLLVFGIMAQLLSEMMGYTPLLAGYFQHLIPSVAMGCFAYYLMIKLRNGNKAGRIIWTVLLVIIFAWSVFMIVMFADV